MSRDSSRTRAAAQPRPSAPPYHCRPERLRTCPLRSVLLPDTSKDEDKDGGDKPVPRKVDLCGTYGCTLPDMHRGLHQFPDDERRSTKRSKPDSSQPTGVCLMSASMQMLQRGAIVEACCLAQQGAQATSWSIGRITACHPGGKVDIQYVNGCIEERVLRKFVRPYNGPHVSFPPLPEVYQLPEIYQTYSAPATSFLATAEAVRAGTLTAALNAPSAAPSSSTVEATASASAEKPPKKRRTSFDPADADSSERSVKLLASLAEYLEDCGGSAEMIKGWYTKTEFRKEGATAGTYDSYFFNTQVKSTAAPSGARRRRARSPVLSLFIFTVLARISPARLS